MHGVGNDYIYVDATHTPPPTNFEYSKLSVAISDRHFGIGSDGLVVILPSKVADFRMRMFNSDGSEAQMCGNASRCIGKFVYDNGLTTKTIVSLETLAGIKILHLILNNDGKVGMVRVDMGKPELMPEKIPVKKEFLISEKEGPIVSLLCSGREFKAYAVSMGNPHGVIFMDESPSYDLVHNIGRELEKHPAWPEKANIEFAKIIRRDLVEMRVWERGAGETLACGTGACATAVAGMLAGDLDRKVEVRLLGGCLEIEWNASDGHVYMTGPAVTVSKGIYYLNSVTSLPVGTNKLQSNNGTLSEKL